MVTHNCFGNAAPFNETPSTLPGDVPHAKEMSAPWKTVHLNATLSWVPKRAAEETP